MATEERVSRLEGAYEHLATKAEFFDTEGRTGVAFTEVRHALDTLMAVQTTQGQAIAALGQDMATLTAVVAAQGQAITAQGKDIATIKALLQQREV